jgi:hypothetical protein
MNQTETLEKETAFSFSELREKAADLSEKKIFGFEKTCANLTLEQTINNYLKTPEEMEAEFSLEMNATKSMIKDYTDIFDTYGRLVKKKDGHANTYSPDDTPSGFMEENY